MGTAVMLFTRDLRLHDNPALHAAVNGADQVVPLFVLDDRIARLPFNRPNRAAFLAESLADLDDRLRRRDGRLVVRRGDVAKEVAKAAADAEADAVHMSADYSRYAVARERRIREALGDRKLVTHPGLTVVEPGAVTTGGGEPFSVFTPYHRRWSAQGLRSVLSAPRRIHAPRAVKGEKVPTADDICRGERSADRLPGGETAGRTRAKRWLDRGVAGYDDNQDALADDGTSRLSAYLHFGCVSPLELAARADKRRSGVSAFVRQLAWRDFYLQVLAARPEVAEKDWRTRNDRWHDDPKALQAWKDGRTGYPLVDAGMRQLRREGWMHNRARLVAGSFLTKHLYLDWRAGAAHFFDLLIDGDIANNCLNWQWVAGTGTDTRPNRILNPTLQQERYDPDLRYVRKYVGEYGTDDYPEPIVDHQQAVAAFRAARS